MRGRWTVVIVFGLLAVGGGRAAADAAPQVDAVWVTDVSSTSASLHGEANPEGQSSSYRFEYETEAAYAANLGASREPFFGALRAPAAGEGALGAGSGDQAASQQVSHLAPGTTYRYRLLATSAAGSGELAAAFTTQPAAGEGAETCANAQLRIEDSSLGLPDCRAYELVSPTEKNGGAVAAPEALFGGGVLQAAGNGEAATWSSSASFGDDALGAPPASQYLSTRGAAGWATRNISQPTLSGAFGDHPDGVPFQLFAPDLSRAIVLDGRRCGGAEECPRSYSLLEGGELTPLPTAPGLRFEGSSPDLRHLVFATQGGLEEWSGGGLEAVSEAPGARLAAQSGAISADGSRVYFSAGGDLYLREGATTRQVDGEVGGGGEFQAASANGATAFFVKGGHLYRFEAQAEDLSTLDLTPAGGVKGVLGASADGSVVYYQGATGLQRWDEGATATVASGAEAAASSDWPPASGTARVSADGSAIAFLSKASLSGYDNTDQATHEPDPEVFLWRAAGGLTCASCNPTGERPAGPSTIPGAIANGIGPGSTRSYKPRNLSSNGRRLFFESADRIVPTDGSAAPDVYEWEASGEGGCGTPGGCVYLISSGRSGAASIFVEASEGGRDAFFLSADSLVRTDPGAVDLYDARAGGGFPVPVSPTPCEGDSCQALPAPPEDPAPATLAPGSANPSPHYGKTHRRKRHHHRRRRRHGRSGHGGSR